MRILALLPVLLLAFSCEQADVSSTSKSKSDDNGGSSSECVSPLGRQYNSQIAAGEMKVLQGKISTVIEDYSDETHDELTIFDTLDGESYLIDQADPSLANAPKGEMIDLAIEPSIVQASGAVRPMIRIINQDMTSSAPIDEQGCAVSNRAPEAEVVANRNLVTKRIGIFIFNMNISQETANNHAKRIADYYNTIGNGKWNVTADAHRLSLTETECSSITSNMSSCVMQAARDHARNIGKSYNYYTTIQNLRSYGICGHGYMPGSTNWNYCGLSVSTQTHEIGHNHGLGHASLVRDDGSVSEYGDRTSTMGTSSSARLTAPHIDSLGLQNPNGIKSVERTQKVFLVPLETTPTDMFDGVSQMASFTKNRREYFVSTRSSGGAFEVSSREAQLVYVHYYGSSRKSMRIAALSVGESFTDNGFTIEFMDKEGDVSEVDIYVNSGDATPPNQNFPVKGQTVNIFLSKSGELEGNDDSFKLGTDYITYRVQNASADAYGCIAYEAADGSRGNKTAGWCNDLEDFTEMRTQKDLPEVYLNPWNWNSRTQEWELEDDLTKPIHYIPGRYWLYFYNPNTQQKDEYIFEVI